MNRSPNHRSTYSRDFFAENERIAMGTGVLIDGLDLSDDKMLVGRTFSHCDTQRYRVGPNELQLPVNQAKGRNGSARTNPHAWAWIPPKVKPSRTRPDHGGRDRRSQPPAGVGSAGRQ
jgi:catalase